MLGRSICCQEGLQPTNQFSAGTAPSNCAAHVKGNHMLFSRVIWRCTLAEL